MTEHLLTATPGTTRIGQFDAAFPPVLTVRSGDSVRVECVSGRADVLPAPGSGMTVPQALTDVLAAHRPAPPGHILTGPIAVEGAMPGDALEVRIDEIEPGADWGYNLIRPLAGTLPEDFHEPTLMHLPVDRAGRTCRLPWGTELALAPFFGVMDVAPPPAFGTVATKEPRLHGGNLDNKELTAGSTLFLPVWVEGARFSVGDGHGVQGDGEVCITALETGLSGTFRLTVRKDFPVEFPFAETPTHLMSIGLDEDLDDAAKQAVREMVKHVCRRTNLSRNQAYMLCSLIGDLRVTQTVDGNKGVHMLLAKSHL